MGEVIRMQQPPLDFVGPAPLKPARNVYRKTGLLLTHVLIAESALGHPLPVEAQVHHVDKNTLNNRNDNLVICQDAAYHAELHRKMRVRAAGGDPWTERLCCTCHLSKPLNAFGNNYEKARGECRTCNTITTLKNRALHGRKKYSRKKTAS